MGKTSGFIVGHMPLMGPQTNHLYWNYLQLLSRMCLSTFIQVFISLYYLLIITYSIFLVGRSFKILSIVATE